jgi:hypothetical protein
MEVIAMDELVVRFPTKCPMCGQESLVGFGLDTMLQALATDRPIKLHANCARHRVVWVASDIERRKIQDYTAAVHVSVADQSHRPRRYAHR